MSTLRVASCVLVPALFVLRSAPLTAQSSISVGLGAGVSSIPSRGPDPRTGHRHSLLTFGVAPSRGPLELRADLMWAHWPSYAGPVSATANALLPVGRVTLSDGVQVRPYAVAGAGYYGVGGPGPELGANGGIGARAEVQRLAVFVEGRRHSAYSRTFLTLGLALRP